MIEIVNLVKHYGKTQALRGISLRIEKGELFAFLGPNGAGKTTAVRIMTGLARLTSGSITLGDVDIVRDRVEFKKRIGLVPQHINLDNELTVFENLFIHGKLHHMPCREVKKRIEQLLDYVGIMDKASKPVKELSGGMKRRAMIARALLHDPAILFLDEPTVGLDAAIRRRIWALIKKIQGSGATVFMTTHYIEEAEFLANRVAFLNRGEIAVLGTPREIMSRIGEWAIDRFEDGEILTSYFQNKEQAGEYAASIEFAKGFSLRRVNLEDAFLELTGEKVK